MKLPVNYLELSTNERRQVRNEYIKLQNNKCIFCGKSLDDLPAEKVTKKKINWELFPDNFLRYPIHLQHNHDTGMTEGAVHSYCNAVMWQYHNR